MRYFCMLLLLLLLTSENISVQNTYEDWKIKMNSFNNALYVTIESSEVNVSLPDIVLNTSLGHVEKWDDINNVKVIHASYCKPFIVQVSVNGTIINAQTFNFTPEYESLKDSWEQYLTTDNENGEVNHHCSFNSSIANACNISVVGRHQSGDEQCTYKKMDVDSTLSYLKPNTSYTFQCLDQFGYTEVSSISHEIGEQRNIFLERLNNISLPDPNEETCPDTRDLIKVENVTVATIPVGPIHLVSWNKISERYYKCLSHYVICRIHRRLKPKVTILSVIKYQVNGHLNNIIMDLADDQNYVYKVKAVFKNSIKTRFSDLVVTQTPKAVNHYCNCRSSSVDVHQTGIRVPGRIKCMHIY
ncbi:hypothetical protein EWB00_002448 [Schistosoma japonicum]|uniref:Fibronectin type-III domain-containing protein n=1 Tax=Schistosoma japonicum TaxID=6182 RepID=A0A4Z2DCP8_SCHJA|nr:hypothetical protein EWB00_002448 [Schistosoma japonicum]